VLWINSAKAVAVKASGASNSAWFCELKTNQSGDRLVLIATKNLPTVTMRVANYAAMTGTKSVLPMGTSKTHSSRI